LFDADLVSESQTLGSLLRPGLPSVFPKASDKVKMVTIHASPVRNTKPIATRGCMAKV